MHFIKSPKAALKTLRHGVATITRKKAKRAKEMLLEACVEDTVVRRNKSICETVRNKDYVVSTIDHLL
ncbi:hypothetical protein IV203_025485 [Nitzschia inconspicua]|uniref:Uncharacterized protein n=1 Tax=Nitzschia inconspicua TaxID=303405 RepID=A0A9K3KAN0_9STRA|nr:hypothetical protein IV203_028265 [Nitzschia inconspicua]KAG7362601.1 hypothetical protein IV203_025485 [Nitzschia inconspicua]